MGKNDQGLRTNKRRYQVIPRVLAFLQNGGDVLLLKGAPNKRIWANLYNGVGGHIEIGEDVYSAALREIHEETGLQADGLNLRAIVNIDAGDEYLGIMMFVFVAHSFSRHTNASHEGELHWVSMKELPVEELVEDLAWLLPRILEMGGEDAPLFLRYFYDEADQLIIQEASEKKQAGMS